MVGGTSISISNDITGRIWGAGGQNIFADAQLVLGVKNLGFGNVDVAKIRRSNDNAEQDFSLTEINNGDATTFTGANNGFVQLLDHTGNSKSALQSVITQQPQIINAGSLITNDDDVVTLFDGIDDFLNVNHSANSVISFAMKVRLFSPDNSFEGLVEGNVSPFDFNLSRNSTTNDFRYFNGTSPTTVSSIGATPIDVVIFGIRGANNQVWMNDNTNGNTPGTSATFTSFRIGTGNTSNQFTNMYLHSFAMWNTDKSADRIEIQNAL